jgi:hypothetical protein
MKKPILLSVLGFLLFFGSFSQNIRYGLNGGINSCGIYGPDKPATFINDYGFKGGFFIDGRIGEHLSTLFELNFTRYNFHFTESLYAYENSLLSVKEKNDYITLPFMLKYKRGYEFIFYYLNVGVQLSGLINQKRETTLYLDNHLVDPNYYYGFENNPFDMGIISGAGFQIKSVSMEMRYYFSTNNIYKRDDTREIRYNILSLETAWQLNYREKYPFGRKTGWKGFKYKMKHLF